MAADARHCVMASALHTPPRHATGPARRPGWLARAAGRLLEAVLRAWCRPQVQGAAGLRGNQRVCYVLRTAAGSEVAMLRVVCAREGLHDPFAPVAGSALPASFCALDRGVGGLFRRYAHVDYAPLLGELFASPAQPPCLLVPVAMFFSRTPGKERSLLRLLFSDHYAATGSLRRLCTILLNRSQILVDFGAGIDSGELASHLPAGRALRRATRLLRERHEAARRAVLGPDLSHWRTLQAAIASAPDVAAARLRADALVREIASDMSYVVIRIFDTFLAWLWQRLYDGIAVDGAGTVRALAQTHALVYAPAHRSHVDYLLLSFVLHGQGLAIPHIAAGVNLDLPLVGALLRRAGAFFMRRSFRDDALYAAVFPEYLHQVHAAGHPVEYFVEGGRSRTGRLLQPRPGLLAASVASVRRGMPRPLAIVPVYIGYERLIEDEAYLRELRGARKRTESLGDVVRARRVLRRRHGRVHVNFGEPLQLDAWLDAARPGWRALDLRADAPGLVPQLGAALLRRINARAAFNARNLVACILLATPNRVITASALVDMLQALLRLLRASPRTAFTLPADDAGTLVARLQAAGLLRRERAGDADDLLSLDADAACLATWYRNNVLHAFVVPASMTAIGIAHAGADVGFLRSRTLGLWPFLAAELSLPWEPAEAGSVVDAWLAALQADGWLQVHGQRVTGPPLQSPQFARSALLARFASPCIERLYVAASVLASPASSHRDDVQLAGACTRLARRLLRLHGHESPEFTNEALFRSVIDLLLAEGFAQRDADGHIAPASMLDVALRDAVPLLGDDFRNALWLSQVEAAAGSAADTAHAPAAGT
jgi:glycerol-3-phosphate O-acyltransferase